jgi:phosphatidylglycerol---prolipoprotein diacylglyceryl transferase
MTTTVVAYFPSPPQGVWHLWVVPIRAYAIFIIIGIIAALLIGDRRWEARGGERGVIYDIALWAVPFGLIGGRLYHVATDWRTYFGAGGAGPAAVLRIWDGGLGIWGAVALGGIGAWIACRRRGIPLPAFGDAIAPGIILAQAIGRLGNYFNQELYGRETTMPWGLEIFVRRDPAGYVDDLNGVSTGVLDKVVQPTFLYELLWNLIVFALLIYLDRRFTIGHGRLFALYVAGYCIGRFGIELLRDDAATHIAGIRINSFTSMFVLIGAVVYLILAPKGREDPATLSASAADRLVPDSIDEDADVPAEKPASTQAVVPDDEPGAEAEAVAAQADPAQVDAPAAVLPAEPEEAGEAEVAEAEPEAAEAEPEKAEEAEAAKAEPEEPEEAEAAEAEPEEPEEAEAAEAEPEKAEEAEAAEAEPEKAEEAEAAEAEPEEAEEPPTSDEPAEAEEPPTSGEPAEAELEAEESDEDEAADVDAAKSGDDETEADHPAAGASEEAAESAADEGAPAEEPTPASTESPAPQSRWRQLNSRLRRR